jgi:hypothetical protein
MKKHLRHWAVAAVGAAVALAFTSCAYDPYYSSVGGSYSSGYGEGYGYGGSSFSTSVFVGTGDPRWGYDPYCYSYYDYSRRCYYDPYLNGYYPIGYRPPVIVGVPHPYGYRHGYCPPPRYIHHGNISNYHNREYAYRNSSYGWAKQVRQGPTQGRVYNQHPQRGSESRSSMNRNNYSKPQYGSRTSSGGSRLQNSDRSQYSESRQPANRASQKSRPPSAYNTPVTRSSTRNAPYTQRNGKAQNQNRQPSQQNFNGGKRGGSRQNPPTPQRGGKNEGRQEENRNVRGLGQG